MNLEFSSQQELYDRVRPALDVKVLELKRVGYSEITNNDIWNYLVIKKWKNSHDLYLSDIVSDILNGDNLEIEEFIRDNSQI